MVVHSLGGNKPPPDKGRARLPICPGLRQQVSGSFWGVLTFASFLCGAQVVVLSRYWEVVCEMGVGELGLKLNMDWGVC